MPTASRLLLSARTFFTLPAPAAFAVPLGLSLNLPSLLPGIFESILRAVPKKKTSHSKKRMRQLAGKALKDVTALNRCSACGKVKRSHMLCEHSHSFDIFGIASTSSHIVSVAGDSNVKVWELATPKHPLAHVFNGAHRLGAHHVAASTAVTEPLAATAGFAGEIIIWDLENMKERSRIEVVSDCDGVWAIAISPKGEQIAATTCDGKINVWNTSDMKNMAAQYTTKGSFGMCIDMSADGNLIASGHQNGGIYIFNNTTERMHHSLQGLVKPIRCVKFSPAGKLLAACGDSNVIGLFDVSSGEQVANLSGHSSWIFSLAWSTTGEYLVSGSFDGKVKVWSMETRSCVATQSEATASVYAVQWLPKGVSGGEGFVSAGANRTLAFYRETSGE
ncbi:WD40 repeat-like protein [Ascodesmis nigricans]|uniref:WD40 repeat-like protein n=1 Tax=Ascodesmis nigricans TaxID=341454 RepID=A0A4S2N8F8_9PEZI|nr:WD40 repeat-like protein [Ascodesmis nigricans]